MQNRNNSICVCFRLLLLSFFDWNNLSLARFIQPRCQRTLSFWLASCRQRWSFTTSGKWKRQDALRLRLRFRSILWLSHFKNKIIILTSSWLENFFLEKQTLPEQVRRSMWGAKVLKLRKTKCNSYDKNYFSMKVSVFIFLVRSFIPSWKFHIYT